MTGFSMTTCSIDPYTLVAFWVSRTDSCYEGISFRQHNMQQQRSERSRVERQLGQRRKEGMLRPGDKLPEKEDSVDFTI